MWTLQVTFLIFFRHKPCKKYAGQERCGFFVKAGSGSEIRIRDPVLKFWFSGSGSDRKWTGSVTLEKFWPDGRKATAHVPVHGVCVQDPWRGGPPHDGDVHAEEGGQGVGNLVADIVVRVVPVRPVANQELSFSTTTFFFLIKLWGFFLSVVYPDPVGYKIICRIRNYWFQIWIRQAQMSSD